MNRIVLPVALSIFIFVTLFSTTANAQTTPIANSDKKIYYMGFDLYSSTYKPYFDRVVTAPMMGTIGMNLMLPEGFTIKSNSVDLVKKYDTTLLANYDAKLQYERFRDFIVNAYSIQYGTYLSGKDCRKDDEFRSYPHDKISCDGFSDTYLSDSGFNDPGRFQIDLSNPTARSLFIDKIVSEVNSRDGSWVYFDNIYHTTSAGLSESYFSGIIETFAEIKSRITNKMIFANIAVAPWGLEKDSFKDCDRFDSIFDGMSFEMPIHRYIRDKPDLLMKELSVYRRWLDNGNYIFLIPLSTHGHAHYRNEQRLIAGEALLIRNPGDPIFVPNPYWQDLLEWTTWPEKLGAPAGSYQNQGNVFSRNFQNGRLEMHMLSTDKYKTLKFSIPTTKLVESPAFGRLLIEGSDMYYTTNRTGAESFSFVDGNNIYIVDVVTKEGSYKNPDIDNDTDIDIFDLDILKEDMEIQNLRSDLNSDGKVDEQDRQFFMSEYKVQVLNTDEALDNNNNGVPDGLDEPTLSLRYSSNGILITDKNTLQLKVNKQDSNGYEEEDVLTITIFEYSTKREIAKYVIEDDGVNTSGWVKGPVQERTYQINLPGPGTYDFEFKASGYGSDFFYIFRSDAVKEMLSKPSVLESSSSPVDLYFHVPEDNLISFEFFANHKLGMGTQIELYDGNTIITQATISDQNKWNYFNITVPSGSQGKIWRLHISKQDLSCRWDSVNFLSTTESRLVDISDIFISKVTERKIESGVPITIRNLDYPKTIHIELAGHTSGISVSENDFLLGKGEKKTFYLSTSSTTPEGSETYIVINKYEDSMKIVWKNDVIVHNIFKDDIERVRAKIALKEEPWYSWYRRLKTSADSMLSYNKSAEVQKGVLGSRAEYAAATSSPELALVYLIEKDPKYLDKIKEFLSDYGDFEKFSNKNAGIWIWGKILTWYPLSYSMVRDSLTKEEDAEIRDRIYGLAQKVYGQKFLGRISFKEFTLDKDYANMGMILDGGLGLSAIIFRDYLDTNTWNKNILNRLFGPDAGTSSVMNAMITPDGFYNEGVYQNDVFSNLLIYLLVFREVYGLDYINGHPGNSEFEPQDGRIARMFYNNIETMMPPGWFAMWDTGFISYAGCGIWAADIMPHNEEHMWFWERLGKPLYPPASVTMLLFDKQKNITAKGPDFTSVILDNGAVFRTGLEENDTYFLLNSEHYTSASGHEQPDQTSFLLYAKNQFLLIDPGDGRYYGYNYNGPEGFRNDTFEYWLERNPEAHNLIIIDDGNPTWSPYEKPNTLYEKATPSLVYSPTEVRDPAYITQSFISDYIDMATVQLNYVNKPDVTLRRTALFPGKEYFVVYDDLDASQKHDYMFMLHYGGSNPPDTATGQDIIPGTLDVNGKSITWKTKNTKNQDISLYVYYTSPVITTKDAGPTNYKGNQIFKHPMTRSRITGTNIENAMVIYPTLDNTKAKPLIIEMETKNGIGIDVNGDYFIFRKNSGLVSNEKIFLDGEGAWVSGNRMFAYNSTKFSYNDKVMFNSEKQMTMTMEYGNESVKAKIKGKGFLSINSNGMRKININNSTVSNCRYNNGNLEIVLLDDENDIFIIQGSPEDCNVKSEVKSTQTEGGATESRGNTGTPTNTNPGSGGVNIKSCSTGQTNPCGSSIGECKQGVQNCVGGQWGSCTGQIGPTEEVCDGLDNNCNGQVDENCLCVEGQNKPCGSNIGICKQGVQSCIGGQWGACIGNTPPLTEDTCFNYLDDNCNGETDEGCGEAFNTCNNGKLDAGEQGTDCGGKCPKKCPDLELISVLMVLVGLFGMIGTTVYFGYVK